MDVSYLTPIYLSIFQKKTLVYLLLPNPVMNYLFQLSPNMEAMGFPFESRKEEKIITGLCENLIVLNLDETIVKEVIRIRRNNKIKLPDAIIAATAIIKQLDLITSNVGDFKSVLLKTRILDPLK